MKGEIRMSEARKCDRCSSYFEYDENMNNYIVFGNRHIIVDLKRGKDFDICPKCMKEFEDWFFPSEEETEETKEVEELEDPCDDCTINIGQRNCIQCRYGYISVEDRKKKYAEDKIEPKLSDPYEEGGL